MIIHIITCLPKLLEGLFSYSIVKRAIAMGKVEIYIHDLRDYATNKYKKVDDYIYGGGAGMLLMIEPIVNCINKIKEKMECDEVIYTTPDGTKLTQGLCNEFSTKTSIIIICGHYKGVDDRVRNFATKEVSIGDYSLSGGEIPAAVIVDATVRLLPGVLSNIESALTDSFQDGLLAPPAYTRPANFNGLYVPDVLLSGNAKKIEEWRYKESIKRTKERRIDLYNNLFDVKD